MIVNLNTLYKPFIIDTEIEIPENFYENTVIKNLKNVHVNGKIYYNLSEELEVLMDVTGTMILEDSITLEDIEYPFSFQIEEILNEKDGENQEYLKKDKNILDIIEFLWENIVLEVPISVTNASNVEKTGQGWQLNGKASGTEIDPRLAKLNELFKGGE